MAGTYREIKSLSNSSRKAKTLNERKGLERLLEEMEEEGFLPNNRVKSRGKSIPTNTNIKVAAHFELDYDDFILLSE